MGQLLTKSDEIKLWTRSAGLCAFPDCQSDPLEDWKDGLLGNKAHVIAKSPNGPRGTLEEIGGVNSYDNLILLCGHHHQLVDNDVGNYPAASLLKMKADHEEQQARNRKAGKPWKRKWNMIHYLNIPRLAMTAATYGLPITFNPGPDFKSLSKLEWDLGEVVHTAKKVLEMMEVEAVWLRDVKKFNKEQRGCFVHFSERVFGKHIPPVHRAHKVRLTGNIHDDPHIHFTWRGCKIMLAVDPKWITTNSAFCAFIQPGRSVDILNGIFQIKAITPDNKAIIGSPMILGVRMPLPGVKDEHQ